MFVLFVQFDNIHEFNVQLLRMKNTVQFVKKNGSWLYSKPYSRFQTRQNIAQDSHRSRLYKIDGNTTTTSITLNCNQNAVKSPDFLRKKFFCHPEKGRLL